MAERGLTWDGRVSIRDLGGLPVAVSEANRTPSVRAWIAEAPDDVARRKRRLLSVMPAAAMRRTLEALERRHGSARGYLVGGGIEEAALDRLAGRLRG